MRRAFSFSRIAWAIVMAPALAMGDPTPLDKPVSAHVWVRQDGKPSRAVSGVATAWDADSVIIKTNDEDHTFHWTDFTGETAYRLRLQLIDRKDPKAWLQLGTLAWGLDDTYDAQTALKQALWLDPKLSDDVDAVLASGAGVLLLPPELMYDVSPEQDPAEPAHFDPNDPGPKYQKVSPATAKAAMAAARNDAKTVSDQMHIDLKQVETDHFLIFTDWDPAGCVFLKKNLEAAYNVVSRQFEIPPIENIFVGKLPVYMFNNHGDFLRFGRTFDNLPTNRKDIAGYYHGRAQLLAHLAMSKPDPTGFATGRQIEFAWAYTLTHEFTHAFVARYRSPRRIPTWLNEGIAEVIASRQFPVNVRRAAIEYAQTHDSLESLFDDSAGMQPASMYPVMRTLTEVLLARDGQKFLQMFDELKAGATGARALKDAYGWTFSDLEAAWRTELGVR
jgi:hypothetical protein